MQKNLLVVVSFMLLTVLNSSAEDSYSALKKVGIVAGLGSITAAGTYATEMNKEYSENQKTPDLKMRATKAIGAALVLVGTDIILGEEDTLQNLAKIAAFSVSLFAITDTAAEIVRPIPIVGGLLTDPVDENGKEIKDSGAFARGLLTYVPLCALAIKYIVPANSTK